jgi:hypothetical protein
MAPSSGCHARSRTRDGVVLLVDCLLSGRHPEIRGGAHVGTEPLRSDISSGDRVSPLRRLGAALDGHPEQDVEDS